MMDAKAYQRAYYLANRARLIARNSARQKASRSRRIVTPIELLSPRRRYSRLYHQKHAVRLREAARQRRKARKFNMNTVLKRWARVILPL